MTGPSCVEEGLWARLVARARQRAEGAEPAHDWFHVERVVANAITIATSENANVAIAATAALLHELFNLPKSHPDSSSAGDVCAEHARAVLLGEGAPADIVEPVVSAIRDHAFSKAVIPEALESRVLQDADRLDAIGAIGLARMWATCAEMKRPFYAPDDPFCATRPPDDKSWGLDHVFKKLLVVPERLHLPTSRRLADGRVRFLRDFVEQLRSEIAPVHGANALAATANRPDAATLAQIVDRAPDGIVASRDGVVLYANDAAALLLGHTTPASLVGQSMATFLDAESLSTMRRRIQQIGEGDRLVPREYAAKRRDG
jgi:uncharacterized protein